MSERSTPRTIPIAGNAPASLVLPESAFSQNQDTSHALQDRLQRPLRDLRISVTDRCNFRCTYCMPKEVFDKEHAYLPHSALLSFEEITRLARTFIALGVQKIRLTGGEPLLRKNIESLIEQLASLRTPDGQPLDIHPHHQRLPAGTQGPGAQRRGAAARHRQPRRARRCRVPPDERRGLPGGRCARRH